MVQITVRFGSAALKVAAMWAAEPSPLRGRTYVITGKAGALSTLGSSRS